MEDNGDRKSVQRSLLVVIRDGAVLSLILFLWACMGTGLYLAFMLAFYNSPVQWEVEGEKYPGHLTRQYVDVYCRNTYENILERLWCQQFRGGYFLIDMPTFLFVTGAPFLLILKPRRFQTISLLTGIVLLYIVHYGVIALNPDQSIHVHFKLSFMVATLFSPVFFKLTRPKDCKIWIITFAVVAAVVVFVVLLSEMKNFQFDSLVFMILGVPILREVTILPFRVFSRRLAMDRNVAGSGERVRKEFCLIFLFPVQVALATWARMMITTISSDEGLTIYVVFNSLGEILLRLTVEWRDVFVMRRLSRIFGSKSPKINPSERKSRIQRILIAIKKSDKAFSSMIVVGEMISEHIGVLANAGLILLFQRKVTMLPLQFYAAQENPFDLNLSPWQVGWHAFVQVFAEFFVDAVCIAFEEFRLDMHIVRSFNALPYSARLINLVTAAFFGMSMALLHVSVLVADCTKSDTSHSPNNFTVCSCQTLPGSVLDHYCLSH